MDIKDIKELTYSISELKKFATGEGLRDTTSNIDKLGNGFNVDNRYAMCREHTISFDTYIGYYGNPSCSKQISIDKSIENIFWNSFDKYLNEHQDEILLGVAKIMEERLKREKDTIKKEIENLNKILDDLEIKE